MQTENFSWFLSEEKLMPFGTLSIVYLPEVKDRLMWLLTEKGAKMLYSEIKRSLNLIDERMM